MAVPEYSVGDPVWADLASSDVDRAISFYGALLGWEVQHTTPELNDYVMFTLHDEPIAGLVGAQAGQQDAWLVYLKTDDASATDAAITANGGTVLFSHPAGDLGTMVVGLDPSGAAIAGWQAQAHAGFSRIHEIGSPAWFEVLTNDFPTAVTFYENVFGWSTTAMPPAPGFRMSTQGQPPIAGIFDAVDYLGPAAPHWSTYWLVENTDASVAHLIELGGTQFDPVQDTPFGRMTHVADPMGATFTLIQPQ